MGLFFNRMKDPVEGTARVVACTPPQRGGTSRNLDMTLVVQALGVEPFSLEHHCMCRVDKWPSPGETLPVVFDRGKLERLKVLWDQVQTGGEWAQEQADAMVESLNAQPGASPPAAGQPTVVGSGEIPPEMQGMIEQLQQQFPGATVNVETQVVDMSQNPELADHMMGMAEQAVGQDLDGDGVIGPKGGAAPPAGVVPGGGAQPAGAGADPIAQLEKLAALRDRGVLTEAEFAAQKAKILDGS